MVAKTSLIHRAFKNEELMYGTASIKQAIEYLRVMIIHIVLLII